MNTPNSDALIYDGLNPHDKKTGIDRVEYGTIALTDAELALLITGLSNTAQHLQSVLTGPFADSFAGGKDTIIGDIKRCADLAAKLHQTQNSQLTVREIGASPHAALAKAEGK